MSTLGLLFLVAVAMLFPVSIGWIIVCITEHRKEKKYDEFYSIHAVRKHGEVVYYQEEIMRSRNGYVFNIVIKFYDEKNNPHRATLHTNHRLKIAMFVLSIFFSIGLLILIGENVPDSIIEKISFTVAKFVPLIAILIPISRLLFSKIHK